MDRHQCLGNARGVENFTISVVVPVYNEEEVLSEFHERLAAVLAGMRVQAGMAEIIYINDGSTDNTLGEIERIKKNDEKVTIVDLSRNFGKEIAMTAGIDHALGDAVVIIDADLQDPPELIPEFVRYWKEGFDVVYGKRLSRDGETAFKKATAYIFYRLFNRLTNPQIPNDTGDFRLLSRRAIEALKQIREQHRFMKGLFAWIGYPQKAVTYKREHRHKGSTKWNYWKLWNFAVEGFTSFSITPLKMASYLGFVVVFPAFLSAGFVIYKKIIFGEPVQGYPSLMVTILFLGGIQLICLGMLGEYLGRIFDETKYRPLYFVNTYTPSCPLARSNEIGNDSRGYEKSLQEVE